MKKIIITILVLVCAFYAAALYFGDQVKTTTVVCDGREVQQTVRSDYQGNIVYYETSTVIQRFDGL